jgi:outer membrane protein assembly factor BamB
MKKLLALLATTTLLTSGCSWFSREEPAVDISELTELASPLASRVNWSTDVGEGADGEGVELVVSLDGSVVYVANFGGNIVAIDSLSGKTIWSKDTGVELAGGPGAGNGLVLAGSTEGDIIALSQSNGAENWRSTVSTEVTSVPATGNGVVAVHTNDGKIVGFDSATGEQRWLFHRSPPVLSLRGSGMPVFEGNALFCGMDGGRLVKLNASTGIPYWETPIAYASGRNELEQIVDIDGNMVLAGNSLYVVTYQGEMAAVNRADGKVRWRRSFSSHQGLASDGVNLYASDSNGHVFGISREDGSVLWKQELLSGRQLSPVVVVGSYVAVADLEGYLHWLSTADGRIVSRVRAVSSRVTAPLVTNGSSVFVYGEDGELASVSPP